ncbi:hypothetical protein [Endozoicomonas lisbonensis]|uniref:Uncharacterized protein n=1 Tax=Endozoicomonas lisbonensis TaxID=3120522 RepID=A0ABV2SPC6_9GAMM
MMPTLINHQELNGFKGTVSECVLMLNVNELIKTMCRLRSTDEERYSEFNSRFHALLDEYAPEEHKESEHES